MEIIRLVEEKFLQVSEQILETLEGELDFTELTRKLKKELDELGNEVLKEVLEAMDEQICKDRTKRKGWTIERKRDKKSILTPFGELNYERTYFKNKKVNKYKYLADERAGIKPHMRVEGTLKSELAEAATKMSYEKATEELSRFNDDLKLSKQTAANIVQEFKQKPLPAPKTKKKVSRLYIEADEDHLTIRNQKRAQTRLIYVHEGVEGIKRRALKSVKNFTTVTKPPEDLWLEVCDYIESHYDIANTQIFISGDGAKWIRTGQEYIPGSIFILDKFHLSQYIIKATAHAPQLRRKIYQNIRKLDKEAVLENLEEALTQAEKEPRQKRILRTIKYITNNWDGIKASVKYPDIGCSAEGHVSHVLASRMSSRPMAWSLDGASKMAAMLAVKADGASVKENYLANSLHNPGLVDLSNVAKREIKKIRTKAKLGKEFMGNIPLTQGGKNLTRVAVRGLNNSISV